MLHGRAFFISFDNFLLFVFWQVDSGDIPSPLAREPKVEKIRCRKISPLRCIKKQLRDCGGQHRLILTGRVPIIVHCQQILGMWLTQCSGLFQHRQISRSLGSPTVALQLTPATN
ncbi:hypothetical protein WI38_15135 [Burkholderia ubonensis]|uniref:Uncharacterized protein n=1 Tax=Burkholderia ubonensis TaxID=101571 RepID=A0A124L795_9BURK|nr:hypothetical protein WI35_09810 [Burkholderia ubonensis]KUZ80283.1 hypothetical protein WI37_07440 [Burkholderia ubonensis]KUZ90215.1 hypothetical protein WI38_15135 [Burkholderia ubonensis]KUZ97575.1 hypothetical protein WI39_08810 [Burkholderia ubonensis]